MVDARTGMSQKSPDDGHLSMLLLRIQSLVHLAQLGVLASNSQLMAQLRNIMYTGHQLILIAIKSTMMHELQVVYEHYICLETLVPLTRNSILAALVD